VSGKPAIHTLKDIPTILMPSIDDMVGTEGVYIVHLDACLSHARHYVGWAKDIYERIQSHLLQTGARILAAAVREGITMQATRIWPGADRLFERNLKRGGNVAMHCPLCADEYRVRRRDEMRCRRVRERGCEDGERTRNNRGADASTHTGTGGAGVG